MKMPCGIFILYPCATMAHRRLYENSLRRFHVLCAWCTTDGIMSFFYVFPVESIVSQVFGTRRYRGVACHVCSCSSTIRLRERTDPANIIPCTALRTDKDHPVGSGSGFHGFVFSGIFADKRRVEPAVVPAMCADMEFISCFYGLYLIGCVHSGSLKDW